MIAVISDIHANLEALDAVLADAERNGATSIICLGDVLGYGPDPVACLERAMAWRVVLLGNHDQAAMADPNGLSTGAEQAVLWHRAKLTDTTVSAFEREKWAAFLAGRFRSHMEDDILFVHGSPRNPLNEYLFPEDVYNPHKMNRIAECYELYCFAGHTHVPGVFVQDGVEWSYLSPEEVGGFYRLDGRKTIVNVGSVGQPRDGDWRACYVLLDGRDVTFRFVEYDVETTVRKVYAVPELMDFQGDRLREGR